MFNLKRDSNNHIFITFRPCSLQHKVLIYEQNKGVFMKKFITPLLIGTLMSFPAFAAYDNDNTATSNTDATTNTRTSTDVDATTNQDSGISLSGKAKIMPHATVSTGDNTASTNIRTSTDVDADTNASGNAKASREENTAANDNTKHGKHGKGHKYGHDKHDM